MILILTEDFDPHADHVAARLAARGAPFVRFNPAAFPTHASISLAYTSSGLTRATLHLDDHPQPIDLHELSSVWFRRPQPPAPDTRIANQATRKYLNQECATVLNDLWHAIDCPIIPGPPNTLRRAELKAAQLATAGHLGFELPPTLITSDPAALLAFFREHNGQIISKLPSSMLYQHTGQTFNRYTHVVSTRDIGYAEAVRQCPVIFQAYVPKRLEIRATVVGSRVFAAEIHSQQTQRTRYDWRRYDHYETPYLAHILPDALARQCVRLVEALGLRYGAIDFVLTPDGRYVFLEINPNGQYLWVEEATGLPISDALCDLLLDGSRATDAARTAALARSHRMTHSDLQPLLGRTLTYLQALARDAVQPDDARAGLRLLEQHDPDHPLDLVWLEEGYDQSLHYDALIRLPGQGTVSLGFSPDRSLPWPLRGVQRWTDQDLVRVNSHVLTVDHAIANLDFIWGESAITQRLIDVCLIKEALDRDPIILSEIELKRAIDAFRRARRLYTADATRAWMEQHGISRDKLERLVTDDATVARLRERVAEGRIESHFGAHADDFATVTVVRLDFTRHEHALEAFEQLQQGASFDALALERLVTEPRATLQSAVLHKTEARDLEPLDGAGSIFALTCPINRVAPADLAEALFEAGEGDIIGPVRVGAAASLLQVRAVSEARLDAPTRMAVQRALFEQWLAERRATASVEWFWGNTAPQSNAVSAA